MSDENPIETIQVSDVPRAVLSEETLLRTHGQSDALALALADLENPVFDGPQPVKRKSAQEEMRLNTEADE